MNLKGSEQMRFAPGTLNPASDSFFSDAIVFELETQPALTDTLVKEEFLKYFRGPCRVVLNGNQPDVDPSKFIRRRERVKAESKPFPDEQAVETVTHYTGTLDWGEPFVTKKLQKLNPVIEDPDHGFADSSPSGCGARVPGGITTDLSGSMPYLNFRERETSYRRSPRVFSARGSAGTCWSAKLDICGIRSGRHLCRANSELSFGPSRLAC